MLVAAVSAAHNTDGVVDSGTLDLVGGSRWRKMTDQAIEAGLLLRDTRDGKAVWRIVDDPDLLHIRPRDEIEWEKQRKRDQSNPALIIPVRARDGDACRYCGNVVNWLARTGARRGCYDHREPGKAATLRTYVVSCYGCNSSRKDDPDADLRHPLLTPPASPFYSPATRELLLKHRQHLPASCQLLSGEQGKPLTEQGEGPGRARDGNGSGPARGSS